MSNPFWLFDEHPDTPQATREIDALLNDVAASSCSIYSLEAQWVNRVRSLLEKWAHTGADDTAAREEIWAILEARYNA